jgi:hypothetical protein
MIVNEVLEGEQHQATGEEVIYTITVPTSWSSSISGPSVLAYNRVTGADVTSTVFPTNSPSVSSLVITLSEMKSLTAGLRYRVEVLFAGASGQVFKSLFYITCQI